MKVARARATPPRQMTLAAWAALDDEVRGELVDGVLEEEELPTAVHEVIVIWFASILRRWVRPRGGFVLGSEAKYALGRKTGRKPDLSVVVKGHLPRLKEPLLHVPPWIAIEVISPRPRDQRRDRVAKMREYARAGIRFYWLIDPAMRLVEILELQHGRYAHAISATEGTLKNIPGCPGLILRLGQLWAEVAEAEEA